METNKVPGGIFLKRIFYGAQLKHKPQKNRPPGKGGLQK
jgi:hypothetical protein